MRNAKTSLEAAAGTGRVFRISNFEFRILITVFQAESPVIRGGI
jgi:hypothetical protein